MPEGQISAGTYTSKVCFTCTDSGGTTTASVYNGTPHPIFTNGYNQEVVQLQMVTIGGPNGLNN